MKTDPNSMDALARLRQQVEAELGIDAGDMSEDECREALVEERRRQMRYVREAGRQWGAL